jgi:UDP:flavonoid glycosyltransferase YjiC (YdhE family)
MGFVRISATVLPGLGHLNPMVPLLRTLAERGHDLEVIVPPAFTPYVERVGLRATGLGPSWTEMHIEDVHPGWHELDGRAQFRVWTEFAARFAPHLAKYIEATRPDVIVHDHFEFAAWLVGERFDIPWVPYAMTVRALDPGLIALCEATDAVDAMREAAGLPPDHGEGRGGSWLYLDALAPSLTAELLPPGPTVHHVRHVADDNAGGVADLPAVMTERRQGRPLIYVTLGTIFNRSEAVMARLIEGAGETDADVLVTVGENGRVPDSTPSNVTVERYVPQASLYPHLAAVVCHGGFGTVFGSIAHGLPVGCAPIAADQSVNAALIAQSGAGCNLATTVPEDGVFPVLQDGEPDPAAVASIIERLLDDESLRHRAAELSEEMSAGRSEAEAADLVEQVVTSGAPVLRP